jgi:aryl-alcohol dehydrogenase-like predicted oxidoreductase
LNESESEMEYTTLKRTDLKVSRLCFGTMTFGKPADQAAATQMIDRCIGEGINFIDTANVYQTGLAESMLGEAIRGKRDKLILATKVRGKMGGQMKAVIHHDGPDPWGAP